MIPFFAVLLLLAGCGEKKDTIRIATKPMTEQFILAEMLSALIQDNTSYAVEITKGIGGGTSNIHPALMKGEFDLYPEYTGTAWMVILKKDTFNLFQICSIYLKNVIWQFFMTIVIAFIALLFFEGEK